MSAPNSHTGLLPCPMCGGTAAANTVRYSAKHVAEQQWEQDTFHGVNCITCGLDNKGIVGNLTPEIAAAAWNRRVQSNGPSDRDAVLEEAAKVCDSLDAERKQEAQQNFSRNYQNVAAELYRQAQGARECAAAIRALKNAAPQMPGTDRSGGHDVRDTAGSLPVRPSQSAVASSEAGAERE